MSSRGVVSISEVMELLKHCASGFTLKETQHHYRVMFDSKIYPTLPLGEHGAKRGKGRCEIKLGHVKQMVKALGIDFACADSMLPRLRMSPEAP